MALVRWNPMHASREMSPFAGLEALRHNMDHLFESWASEVFGNGDSGGAMWTPHLDIEETDQAFVIHVDLPGVEQDAIDVHLEGNTLFSAVSAKANVRKRRASLGMKGGMASFSGLLPCPSPSRRTRLRPSTSTAC